MSDSAQCAIADSADGNQLGQSATASALVSGLTSDMPMAMIGLPATIIITRNNVVEHCNGGNMFPNRSIGSHRLNKAIVMMLLAVATLSMLSAPAALAKGPPVDKGPPLTECDGLIGVAEVVNKNLIVPANAWCGIDGTVNGNIFVSETGSLVVGVSATVNGNIQSESNATGAFVGLYAVAVWGYVDGNVSMNADGWLIIPQGTVTGNVTMNGDGRISVQGFGVATTVGGNVVSYSDSNDTFVGSAFGGSMTVGGHVKAKGVGGGLVTDQFAATEGTTTVGGGVCGATVTFVNGASSVGGQIEATC